VFLESLFALLGYLESKLWLKNPIFDKNIKAAQKVSFAISGQTLASHNLAAD